MSSITSDEIASIREILDQLMPYDLDIKIKDVMGYLKGGFNREEYIERMVQGAKDDPLMSIKLKLIYAELDRLYRISEE